MFKITGRGYSANEPKVAFPMKALCACSKCGGKMKIIAAIEDPKVVRKILEHMGLATKAPPLYPARGPPKVQHHFEDDFNQQHFEMNFDNFNLSAD